MPEALRWQEVILGNCLAEKSRPAGRESRRSRNESIGVRDAQMTKIAELPDGRCVRPRLPVDRDRFPLLLVGVDDFHGGPPFLYGIMPELPFAL